MVAFGTAVHWNVTGDVRPVALFAGETSVGMPGLDGQALLAVKWKCVEDTGAQFVPRASAHHSVAPAGMLAVYSVSCVVVSTVGCVLPLRMALRRYREAPATAFQSNLTS